MHSWQNGKEMNSSLHPCFSLLSLRSKVKKKPSKSGKFVGCRGRVVIICLPSAQPGTHSSSAHTNTFVRTHVHPAATGLDVRTHSRFLVKQSPFQMSGRTAHCHCTALMNLQHFIYAVVSITRSKRVCEQEGIRHLCKDH